MNSNYVQIDEPFFMTNEEWYEFDTELRRLVLTDKAPPEALESYNEFYGLLEGIVLEE